MPYKFNNRICEMCKKEYSPTNSRQMFCKDCRRVGTNARARLWNRNNKDQHAETCRRCARNGTKLYRSNWKTAKIIRQYKQKNGYINYIFQQKKQVPAHVHIMRLHLGEWFDSKKVSIHHINGVRDDNRIENLMLVPIGKSHTMIDELKKLKIENKKLKERIYDLEHSTAVIS